MSAETAQGRARSGEVLVLGTDARVVLAVARSLGRGGVRVHLGWCAPDCPALRSRYVALSHAVAPYHPTNLAWKEDLLGLLSRRDFDLVIPCNDSTVVPLQTHRRDCDRFAGLHLLPEETFAVAFDTFWTYEVARSLGVSVPRGRMVFSSAEALDAAEESGMPAILKPRATVTPDCVATSNVVRRARNAEELRALLDGMSLQEGVLVQENFVGRGVGVEMLAYQGEVLFAFQHARIHETMEYGSSYRMSVPLDGPMHAAACALMRALNYSGTAMAEFIRDPDTGRWAFLEINGRFWGSLPLAVAAGADFPYYLYQMWVEGRRQFPPDYRLGVYCRNLVLDYRARNRWLGEGRWTRLKSLAGAACQILWRDHLDSFARDDLRPGFEELRQWAATAAAGIRRKLSGGRNSASRLAQALVPGAPRHKCRG